MVATSFKDFFLLLYNYRQHCTTRQYINLSKRIASGDAPSPGAAEALTTPLVVASVFRVGVKTVKDVV
jgi:hypothetical protein